MAPKEDAANQSKAAGDSSLCHLSIPPLPPLNAGEIALLPNQSWVCLASNSKADLLTLGCGEGKSSIHVAGAKLGEWASHAQKTQTAQRLSGEEF